jgi:hypothetical protein
MAVAVCRACSARDTGDSRPRSPLHRARCDTRAQARSGVRCRAQDRATAREGSRVPEMRRAGPGRHRRVMSDPQRVAPHRVRRLLEMDREVKRLGTRPPNVRDARPQFVLQRFRRGQSGLSERNCEKAPHPAGFAVVVGSGVAAGDGLGLGATHGLPPALAMFTVIWFATQSSLIAAKTTSPNQAGRSITE